MGKMHTDDSFMYNGFPIGDAMQKAWENQMLDDYETPADMSSVETDPLVNRITHQRGPKVSANVQPNTPNFDLRDEQEQALDDLVRNAEELDLYDDEIVHDLTKPLSQQIGGEHYRQGDIQPIEYIHANDMDFFSGNVVKYITRWKYKSGLEDLKKAKHYIELLIEQEYGSE